ncbi:MAG TPA: RluA family pseudouridine synthase [Clostridiaceae bacterium]|nr:RluA family pseudouridine synthase [Clostridiaceae bacterium]
MKEISIISEDEGIRIDVWLTSKLEDISRTYVQKLITDSNVTVNDKVVKTNYKIKAGDKVRVEIPEPRKLEVIPEKINIDIVYEDDDIIIVNKPKGMVVHPAAGNYSGTLVNALMDYCGDRLSDINGVIRPGIVHRIDKDTSGLLVVAKNNQAHEKLSAELKTTKLKRVYETIVQGVIVEESGTIDAPIGRHEADRKKMSVNTRTGKRAVTHFKVLERFNNATYLEVRLETGRTHQIRVHMAYIGHPVIGDKVYGGKQQKYSIEGQVLHAKTLGFHHPTTGKYMEFTSQLPEYFINLLKQLREA